MAIAIRHAQGIEAEIPQAPPDIRTRKRVDEPMRRGVAPANAAVRKKRGTAIAAPARDVAGRGIGADSPTPPQAGMRPNFKTTVLMLSGYWGQPVFPRKGKISNIMV
jgi:hypothetical protein